MKLGVVGTSWITEEFIKAARALEGCEITSLYSRTEEKGEKFKTKNSIPKLYTNYEDMLKLEDIQGVYIGSPNALHFEQALRAIQMGKHVICEKAITSNGKELSILLEEAKKYHVVIIEALKSLSMPIFKRLQEEIQEIGPIRKVFFNFCQYSSKYDAYKQGELPNIFNPQMSAGGLMDIGIYCIYPCIALFGKPKSVYATMHKLESGVDGGGSITLVYEEFEATLIYSKMHESFIPNEIMGEEGSLIIHRISSPKKLEKVMRKDRVLVDLTPAMEEEPMFYEVKEFINTIQSGKDESSIYTHELMQSVMELLDELRKQNQIVFPADFRA